MEVSQFPGLNILMRVNWESGPIQISTLVMFVGTIFLRSKDLGFSVLERSVTDKVHLSLYNKFPLFLHADDEEQSNVKDSIKESGGNIYLNTWTY